MGTSLNEVFIPSSKALTNAFIRLTSGNFVNFFFGSVTIRASIKRADIRGHKTPVVALAAF